MQNTNISQDRVTLPKTKVRSGLLMKAPDISELNRTKILVYVYVFSTVVFVLWAFLLCHRTRFFYRWLICNAGAARRERAIEEATRTPRRTKFAEELQAKWELSRRERLRKSLLALEEEQLQEAHVSWKERLEERESRARYRKKQIDDKEKQLHRQIRTLRGRARLDMEERDREQRLEDMESSLEVRHQHLNALEKEINEALVDMRARALHSEESLTHQRPLSAVTSREQFPGRSPRASGRASLQSPARRSSEEYQKTLASAKLSRTRASLVQISGTRSVEESPYASKRNIAISEVVNKPSLEKKYSSFHTTEEQNIRRISLSEQPETSGTDDRKKSSLRRKSSESSEKKHSKRKSSLKLPLISSKSSRPTIESTRTESTLVEDDTYSRKKSVDVSNADNLMMKSKESEKRKSIVGKEREKKDTERRKMSVLLKKPLAIHESLPSDDQKNDESQKGGLQRKSSLKPSTPIANTNKGDSKDPQDRKSKSLKESILITGTPLNSDPGKDAVLTQHRVSLELPIRAGTSKSVDSSERKSSSVQEPTERKSSSVQKPTERRSSSVQNPTERKSSPGQELTERKSSSGQEPPERKSSVGQEPPERKSTSGKEPTDIQKPDSKKKSSLKSLPPTKEQTEKDDQKNIQESEPTENKEEKQDNKKEKVDSTKGAGSDKEKQNLPRKSMTENQSKRPSSSTDKKQSKSDPDKKE